MSALLHMAVLSSLGSAGGSYDAAAEAVFAAMASPPDTTRKGHIDTLIVALKTAGVWAKLDHFVVCANTAAADGLLDWKNPGTPFTAVTSPTFTSDRGYSVGTGGAHILGPSNLSALTQYTQNSAHLAIWSRTAAASTLYDGGTVSGITVRVRIRNTTDAAALNINSGSGADEGLASSVTDGSGFFLFSRDSSTNANAYRNGSLLHTSNNTSTAPAAVAPAFGYVAAANGAPRQIALVSVGADLSADASAYYSAVAAYMTAVGAA